ncbi:selT/selW/selH selenoprotein [Dictyocaulus viviparus]|uniref:SelT/selW/selH selenoprotein n=1 Tax=Dictyocaulus viviparus TaxID=29172 RepID=A0A0D8XWC4_DICVI|nr:selT/selW/selH selenoprotein [Dictyocaulus viviparus]
MTGRSGYLFLLALFVFSMIEVCIKANVENDHDVDEFREEFGDEPQDIMRQSFYHTRHVEDEHVELREGSHFTSMKPKSLSTKKLPSLRFLYCISCGYKQAYEQFSMAVREKYPEMPIEGSNYPPEKWKEFLAHTINILKIGAIAVVVSGRNPFSSFGMNEPVVLQWAQSNKLKSCLCYSVIDLFPLFLLLYLILCSRSVEWIHALNLETYIISQSLVKKIISCTQISACMMLFLLTNMVESTLMSTGAFEIYLDKEQIWSKLESGRVPSPQELIQMIDSQLELSGKGFGGGSGFGDFNH